MRAQGPFVAHVAQQRHEIEQVPGVLLGSELVGLAAQCGRGARIGARCPSQPEVHPSRVQRFERGDVLGHDEWRMVGQHDAARADVDPGGEGRQVGHQDRRCRRGDRGHVVVLRDPEALVVERVGELRDRGGRGQGIGAGATFGDDGQVQHRQGRSCGHPSAPRPALPSPKFARPGRVERLDGKCFMASERLTTRRSVPGSQPNGSATTRGNRRRRRRLGHRGCGPHTNGRTPVDRSCLPRR